MQWEVGLLILGIMFIIAAMFSLGRSRNKASAAGLTARDNIERFKQKQAVKDDLESLMVDIEQMARRLSAQLDAKTMQVEKANREADERIAQLQALKNELARPASTVGSNSETAIPASSKSANQPSTDADPVTREVYALADQGQGAAEIARRLSEHQGKVELILALRNA